MYPSYYYNNNNQMNIDKIDNQIRELETLKSHLQKPQPSINQTFQIAPTQTSPGTHYVESENEVKSELVFSDTVFLAKDLTTMWLKTVKGDIREFRLDEVKKEDEKDLIIKDLQKQIKELKENKKEVISDEPDANNADKPVTK